MSVLPGSGADRPRAVTPREGSGEPTFFPSDNSSGQAYAREGAAADKKHPKYLHTVDEHVEQMSSEDEQEVDNGRGGRKPSCFRSCVARVKRVVNTVVPPGGLIASSFTLGSSTLGAGILGLSAAFNNMGIGLACIILVVMTLETIFSLWLLARCTYLTDQHTYSGVVRRILGKGPDYVAAIFMLGFCLGGGVSYIISIGNLLTPVFDDDAVPAFLRTKSGNRLMTSMVWLVLILPLTLPKHIDSLRHTSLIGVIMVVFFVLCIVVDCCRYLRKNPWREDVRFFGRGNSAVEGLGTIAFAYLVQINGVEIAYEVDKPTPARMARNSAVAISGCGILYVLAGLFGYMRFGREVESSILLMYQPREAPEFWVAYFGMMLKIVLAFALHQIPLRDGIYHFVNIDVYKMAWWKNAIGSVIIALITLILGLFIPNINVVLGLAGSLCGGFIGFIFPALMSMYCGHWSLKNVGLFEWCATYILLITGVIAVVWGTAASIYGII